VFKSILFTVFLFSQLISWSQSDEVIIPFTKNSSNVLETDILLNGYKSRFIFDTGASNVSFSSKLYKTLVQKGLITQSDIIREIETVMANGDIAKALIVNIKRIDLGDSYLENIEAMIIKGNNVPPLLGQSALEKFGTITIDNQKSLIFLKRIKNLNSNLELNKLKLIPCDVKSIKFIKGLHNYLKDNKINNFSIKHIEIEKNIPPFKAIQRLKNIITIRYFDEKDLKKVNIIKKILAQGADERAISIENMTSLFKNPISGLIEVWVSIN
jgi:clan AA aspartic protease (TIGR02281 family)